MHGHARTPLDTVATKERREKPQRGGTNQHAQETHAASLRSLFSHSHSLIALILDTCFQQVLDAAYAWFEDLPQTVDGF